MKKHLLFSSVVLTVLGFVTAFLSIYTYTLFDSGVQIIEMDSMLAVVSLFLLSLISFMAALSVLAHAKIAKQAEETHGHSSRRLARCF